MRECGIRNGVRLRRRGGGWQPISRVGSLSLRGLCEEPDHELGGGEGGEVEETGFGEAVGVEADAEEVGSEPTEGGDGVAEDGEDREAAGLDEAAQSGVEDDPHGENGEWLPGLPPDAAVRLSG